MTDDGDGWASRCQTAEDYAALLLRERDDAEHRDHRYLLIITAALHRIHELTTGTRP